MRASENHLGAIGHHSVFKSGSFNRPADTVAYASGDVMNDSTSAPTVASIAGCARMPGYGGSIQNAQLISDGGAVGADLDVFLFSATLASPGVDNAAFTPSDAEALNCVGIIRFTSANSASSANNRVWFVDNLWKIFQCAAGGTTLFWAPVWRGAYTPAASEKFTLTLGVLQD